MWFVEFYSEFSDTCNSTKAIWNDFSLRYTTKYLKFAEINVDNFPNIAKDF